MMIPILVTPFDNKFHPDIESLLSLIDYLKKLNSNEFWLFGTGGEDFALNIKTRMLILTEISKTKDIDKNMIYVGLGNTTFDESILLCKQAQDLGFTKYHFIQPSKVKSIESTFKQLKEIKQTFNKIQLYAYFSDNYSRPLAYKDLASASQYGYLDYIEGIKYSTSDLDSLGKARIEFGELNIIPAKAAQIIETLKLGYTSSTSIEACIHLKKLNLIIQKYIEGETQIANSCYIEYINIAKSFKTTAAKHNFMNIAEIKYTLFRKGIIKHSKVSRDLWELSREDMEKLDKAVDSLIM